MDGNNYFFLVTAKIYKLPRLLKIGLLQATNIPYYCRAPICST